MFFHPGHLLCVNDTRHARFSYDIKLDFSGCLAFIKKLLVGHMHFLNDAVDPGAGRGKVKTVACEAVRSHAPSLTRNSTRHRGSLI